MAGVRLREDADYLVPAMSPRDNREPVDVKAEHLVAAPNLLRDVLKVGPISGVCMDSMHDLDLGVFCQYIDCVWKSSTPAKREELEARMALVKRYQPTEFQRRVRPLGDRNKWKATEFKNFILYYGYSVFSGIVSDDEFTNFKRLSFAVRILMRKDMEYVWDSAARPLVKNFLQAFEAMHTRARLSMKMHRLSHLVDNCHRFGPLYKHCAYPFEGFIHFLKALCHSPILPAQQIFNRTMELWQFRQDHGVLEPQPREFKVFRKAGVVEKVRFKGITYGLNDKDAYFAHHDPKDEEPRYYKIIDIIAPGESAKHVQFTAKKLAITENYADPCDSGLLGIFTWPANEFEEELFVRKISDFIFKVCVLPINSDLTVFVALPMSDILDN